MDWILMRKTLAIMCFCALCVVSCKPKVVATSTPSMASRNERLLAVIQSHRLSVKSAGVPIDGFNLTPLQALQSAQFMMIFMEHAYGARSLTEFHMVDVKCEDVSNRMWSVWFYEGEAMSPGGEVTVLVDDRTGQAVDYR